MCALSDSGRRESQLRILVADTFSAASLEKLRASRHDVEYAPGLETGDLAAALDGYQVIVVRSTRVPADVIEAGDSLQLIVRAGAGTNTIDVAAAALNSVVVCNTPGQNAAAVAELVMALICAIDRNVPDNVADLRAKVWNKKKWSQARGLAGHTLGIIGFGDVGAAVARRAHAFDMDILTLSRPHRSDKALERLANVEAILVEELETLAATADIITIHVPSVAGTVGLIGREFLRHVRPGTVLINTARGDVVDEDALLEVIDDKQLRVGLDVYRNEPAAGDNFFDSRLAQHPRVYGTHHIGASTGQAQQAVADEVVVVIEEFAAGRVHNQVLA